MRNLPVLLAACASFTAAVPAAATVSPPTKEDIIISGKRQALEERARVAFSDRGLIEKLRDWRKNWGFILVGDERSKAPPRLLIKDEYGWYEVRPGQTKRLPQPLGHELNRLLSKSDLWAEDPYNFKAACRGTPRYFVVMHGGQDRFGRLGCGPEGIAARVARTAEALRVLPGEVRTTATPQPEQRPRPPGAPDVYWKASSEVTAQIFEMAAAWDRKTFAGFVEPYAEDAIVERPDGVTRGRKAIVDWARYLQNWDGPYSPDDRKLAVHQIVSKVQPGVGVFYTTHEFRWEEGGKPLRQTYSTLWRDYGGLWRIAHERISEVKPVTARQPIR
ncbi:nuclear transport factor 2 family protein [Sphingomonas lutea]|uniref:Nuclear transport factor 2 family protein n=1 Tax=Sphingomonas lutea TaxID=1045317 RepID=A0A7G9SKS3_9SPHN|nr:nuclear transport factor 2 family protein [Sphingomonas lutea]QNN68448.1 nuclear transport factor 2 family protein [Sphingomonas lutea]